MTIRMLQRRGTSAEWAAANPILGDGELGFNKDTDDVKIGDGITHWNDLPYLFERTSIYNAKGDLVVGTGADTSAILSHGATGTFLQTQADGSLAWGSVDFTAVNASIATRVAKAGDTMTGSLMLGGDTTVYAKEHILLTDITQVGLVVKAASGHTARLLSFRDSTLGTLLEVNALGAIKMGTSISGALAINLDKINAVSTVGIGIKGIAGQTGDYIQIQNSAGTMLTRVDSTGNLILNAGAEWPQFQWARFDMASGTPGYIAGSGTQLKLRGGSGGLVLQNNADTAWTFSVDNIGGLASNGSGAGLTVNDRDGNPRGYILYVTNNTFRVYSTATPGDKFVVDSSGNVIAASAFNVYDGGSGLIGGFGVRATLFAYHGIELRGGRVSGTAPTPATGGSGSDPSVAIFNNNSGQIPLLVTGTTGQTANLFEAYNASGGTRVVAIDNNGNILGLATRAIAIGYVNDPAATGAYIQTNPSTNQGGSALINTRNANNKALILQGSASQVADPFQIMNSAFTVLAAFDAGGGLSVPAAYVGARVAYGTLSVTAQSAGTIGEVIRGVTSQSADLTQWQNVGGTVLASVSQDGSFVTKGNVAIGSATSYLNSAHLSLKNVAADVGSRNIAVQLITSQTAEPLIILDAGGSTLLKVDSAGTLTAYNSIVVPINKVIQFPATSGNNPWIGSAGTTLYLRGGPGGVGTGGFAFRNNADNATIFYIDDAGNATAATLALSNATVTTVAPASGGGSTLPTKPAGYVTVTINGTARQIAYY